MAAERRTGGAQGTAIYRGILGGHEYRIERTVEGVLPAFKRSAVLDDIEFLKCLLNGRFRGYDLIAAGAG